MKKLFASIASICAAAALAVTASAYTVDLDTGVFWNSNTIIPSEEFAECTTDTTVVFSITTDESLSEMKGHEYWCVKPMVNDSGWPFLKGLIGLELSEGGDSYPVPVGTTEMKFRFTAEELELVQNAGMALMGHGVVISEMTFTDEPLTPAAPAESGDNKGNPDTGVEGVAAVAGAAVAAAGVMVLAKKRK